MNRSPRNRSTDLVVVGAGPAGLATAIRAHQRGLRAVVIDRRHPPIDKPCGEGLMPDGLDRLRQLGVTLSMSQVGPLEGIRYVDGELSAEARFPGGGGFGVRRLVLQQALVERAEGMGVDLRWGMRATGLLEPTSDFDLTGIKVEDGELRARFVVGADGLHSKIRSWAGLDERPPRRSRSRTFQRFGVRRHYRLEPWTDHVEVHWTDRCEAYVTPVSDREVGVAMLWSGSKGGFDDHLGRFPRLAERLSGHETISRDRGCGPLERRVKDVVSGRTALVGDASGYLDAITGEGLSIAFHQAFALVEAIDNGRLASYRRAHRRIGRLPNALTRGLLFAERRPRLRRRLIRGLAADPELFARLLGLHARTLSPVQVGVVPTLRLAYSLASG